MTKSQLSKYVRRVGVVNAAKTIGVGREALLRYMSDQGIRLGTRRIIERAKVPAKHGTDRGR